MDMLLEAEKILVEEDAAVAPWRFYGRPTLWRRPSRASWINRTAVAKTTRCGNSPSGSEVQDNHARRKRGIPSSGIPP